MGLFDENNKNYLGFFNKNYLEYFLHLHIGKLGKVSLKHRGAILFLSVLMLFMLFIDPNVKVIFGKTTIAGLGISVEPPQTIYIGIVLVVLLIYRLIAFWASVLLENGTDENIARRKAQFKFDDSWDAEDIYSSQDLEKHIENDTNAIVSKWKTMKILWELVFPTILALIALAMYIAVCIIT